MTRAPFTPRLRFVSRKETVLARVRYAIPAAESKLISLRLRKIALPLLERARHHKLRATAITTEGSERTANRALVLRLANR